MALSRQNCPLSPPPRGAGSRPDCAAKRRSKAVPPKGAAIVLRHSGRGAKCRVRCGTQIELF
ncbi:hypothetical protein CR492_07935 [Methylocella silvestris]|uniref:Uncharacterized protein n=1 Tax=Methylocella silvestris TaxID=199596 RepID=A0A2J7TIK5_METSI|nr:hypothetical protein CR492_07935 [Methylocella silvestris]